jgi:hypothetical protein
MPDADDREFQAMQTVYSALDSLDEDARSRVLDYVLRRLGVRALPPSGSPATTLAEAARTVPSTSDGGFIDIRTLRERKAPRNAVEMAALVAYYLTEKAPEADRKNTIGTSEIQKYFKQAGFRLPSSPRLALHQGKNAGYLDQATRGHYKLNPVGFNLIEHGLPAASGSTSSASAARSTRAAGTRRQREGRGRRSKKVSRKRNG